MKTFLQTIQARADAAQATLNTGDQTAFLEAAANAAKAEFERAGYNSSPKRTEAHAAWTAASQAASLHRNALTEAENVLRECTPILNAHDDLANAHRTYTDAKAATNSALGEIANLENLINEIKGEVVDMSAKAQQALTAHGQSSVAARLVGQQAQPTPKQIITLTIDLESRKATLESAETMLVSAEQRRKLASECAAESRNLWQHARGRVAKIDYQNALAIAAPQIAIYLVTKNGYENSIEFYPGQEAIDAAQSLINAELEQVN